MEYGAAVPLPFQTEGVHASVWMSDGTGNESSETVSDGMRNCWLTPPDEERFEPLDATTVPPPCATPDDILDVSLTPPARNLNDFLDVAIDEKFDWGDFDYAALKKKEKNKTGGKGKTMLSAIPPSYSMASESIIPLEGMGYQKANGLDRNQMRSFRMKSFNPKKSNNGLTNLTSRRSSVIDMVRERRTSASAARAERRNSIKDGASDKELGNGMVEMFEKYVPVKKFGRKAEKLGQFFAADANNNDMDFDLKFESTESVRSDMFESEDGEINSAQILKRPAQRSTSTNKVGRHYGMTDGYNRGVDPSSGGEKLANFLNSWIFEFISWILIILNCVALTVMANYNNSLDERRDQPTPPTSIQHAEGYNTFYNYYLVVEVLIKSTVAGSRFFEDTYNLSDFILVLFMYIPFSYNSLYSTGYGSNPKIWLSFSVVRLLRVVRITDWVRYEPFFHELHILVKGHASSMKVLVWALIFGALFQYVFAVFISTIIGSGLQFEHRLYRGWFLDLNGIDVTNYSQNYFGSALYSMISLFRVMTLDNWSELIDPLVHMSVPLKGFFVTYILFAVFCFQSLVTAVIVEASTKLEKEEQSRLERLFLRKLEEIGPMLESKLNKKRRVTASEMKTVYLETPSIRKVMKTFGIMDIGDLESLLLVISDPRKPDDVRTKLRIKDILLAMTRYSNRNAKTRDIMELLAIAKRTGDEVYWQTKRIEKMKAELRKFLKLVLRTQQMASSDCDFLNSSFGSNMGSSFLSSQNSRSTPNSLSQGVSGSLLTGSMQSEGYYDIDMRF